VRGLDYYTRTAFEFYRPGAEGQQQALGGGGRYDGLVELLGGQPTPGIGFGIGLDRVALALAERSAALSPEPWRPAAVVVGADAQDTVVRLQVATELRGASTEVRVLAASLRDIASRAGPQLDATLAGTSVTVQKLARTADSLDRIVSGNEGMLAQFAGSGVGDLQQLIIDLRATSEEMRALARSLRDNPSSLLIERKESGLEIPP